MKAAATATAGSEVTKAKDKINIKLFLSHDVVDDGGSDIEHSVGVSNGVRIYLIMLQGCAFKMWNFNLLQK